MRVLLIDDDMQMTRITSRTLTKAGFDVRSTNRSYGVLNLVAELRPDVVLVDMHMPGLKGTELLELLRGDGDLASVRVVFFSGMAEAQLESCSREAGADGYVHKTAGVAALIQALRAA